MGSPRHLDGGLLGRLTVAHRGVYAYIERERERERERRERERDIHIIPTCTPGFARILAGVLSGFHERPSPVFRRVAKIRTFWAYLSPRFG